MLTSMIRLLRHDDTVHREDDGAVRFDDLTEMFESRFAGASHWSIEPWISFLAKGGGPKKGFQCFMNPNSSKYFLCFRAIQGLVDPTLQDNVLLPNDFAGYIFHIGNAHDIHSIIQGGLIPGGRSLKRDRQSVFFTAVNPMYAYQDLESSPKCRKWVQSEARSKKRIAVLPNTIPRNRSFQHTTCDTY